MGNTAILAIRIISDAKSAAKGFQDVETRSQKMGRATGTAAKVASVGLLALGAAGLSAARAASEDAASASRLAGTLKRTAGATKEHIRATEEWISKQSAAKGVADDELRPALGTLATATGDVAKAQDALKIAMDVSAQTGKPLAAVSAALAKGYGGNTTALGKLVPGLDKAVLKSGDMTKITAELAKLTGGAASEAAQTNEGKTRRQAIAMGELQEQIGAFLLPILGFLVTTLAAVTGWVSRNATAATILVAILAALAAAVIVVNLGFKVYTAGTRAAAAATWIYNNALRANPIGIVITAIIILVGLFVLAYKKSATFRAIVQAAGRAGQAAMQAIVGAVRSVISWFGNLGPAANKAKDIGVRAFRLYTTPIRTVVNLVKDLIGWIGRIHFPKPPSWVSKVGGLFGGAPAAAQAAGGRVSVTGRGGPAGAGGFTTIGGVSGFGTNVTIIVQGAVDKVATAKQIASLLREQGIRVTGTVTG